jgi:hypothetical protein
MARVSLRRTLERSTQRRKDAENFFSKDKTLRLCGLASKAEPGRTTLERRRGGAKWQRSLELQGGVVALPAESDTRSAEGGALPRRVASNVIGNY